MLFPYPVLHALCAIVQVTALIRPMMLAGPAFAVMAGGIGWLMARCCSGRGRAANDNHPRLAPLIRRG
jgi:hypothetical protein